MAPWVVENEPVVMDKQRKTAVVIDVAKYDI